MDLPTLTAAIYTGTLALLAVYGIHRLSHLFHFRWEREASLPPRAAGELPVLTVQLPVYNERTVAARLIRAAGALEYPRERLEIQVLDDSTDETRAVVDEEVARLCERGVDAKVVRRATRTGFKAGALDNGQRIARGELLAVFDADFLPEPDFLLRLVGRFADPRVGMVQARWGHVNRDENLLTRAESVLLDGHFVIEHKVRHDTGCFFNFNGTAGIWRRAAIESAGGWEHDTLTEDLDLSYRAQLQGWEFVYEPRVVAPAEVPTEIAAFKSQQHRWAKGGVQVLRKLGPRLLAAPLPLRVKREAFAHLTGNVGYPAVLVLALTLPLAAGLDPILPAWTSLLLFLNCTLAVLAFYDRSQRAVGRPVRKRVVDTFAALVLGIGLCVSQTRAVFAGLLPGTGTFVRTPKRGDAPRSRRYRSALRGLPGIELVLAAWFVWGILAAIENEAWLSLPFLALFLAGFAWVGWMSLADVLRVVPGVRAVFRAELREAPSA